MNLPKRGAAFIATHQLQNIDHLAIVAIIMGIPLVFLDEESEGIGRKYYPGLISQLENDQKVTPEFLISHYDVLFTSDLWKKEAFERQFKHLEEKNKKRMRRVFCPHGFSDKIFYFKCCAGEDICLVYGQKMLDFFKAYGILETINGYVVSGNYRYPFYRQHQSFYDQLVKEEILSHFDKARPIILYAPTWQDTLNSTTFFDAHTEVMENLPDSYNMIVKVHPMLELNDPVGYYRILGKYEKRKNMVFVREFSPVYPILSFSDIYLGDLSSVGYDFLAFNRPLFFLSKQKEKNLQGLFDCGVVIQPDAFSGLYRIIDEYLPKDQEMFAGKRTQLYQYTFGEERAFHAIRDDILKALY